MKGDSTDFEHGIIIGAERLVEYFRNCLSYLSGFSISRVYRE